MWGAHKAPPTGGGLNQIMRAFDPEVQEAIWQAIVPLIPTPIDNHPLGCHRRRVSDRDCFQVMLVRLVTGCSWEDAEYLCANKVSDTTVRARRNEWIEAGVYDAIVNEALDGYDRIIGLDLSDTAVDGSLHKAPTGGEASGKNPTDRAKLGWKWSILTDKNGIPIGWAIDGANRHDSVLFSATLDAARQRGLLEDIETIWLDRGYDSSTVRDVLAAAEIDDAVIAKKRKRGEAKTTAPKRQPMGLRWPVERTNSWLSNFGVNCRYRGSEYWHGRGAFAVSQDEGRPAPRSSRSTEGKPPANTTTRAVKPTVVRGRGPLAGRLPSWRSGLTARALQEGPSWPEGMASPAAAPAGALRCPFF
jgi:transposase